MADPQCPERRRFTAPEGARYDQGRKLPRRCEEHRILIFLPFLVIDLVVAAVLMSMGMMMVPPAIVALPFKLAFFVVADGWMLVAAALVQSYQ